MEMMRRFKMGILFLFIAAYALGAEANDEANPVTVCGENDTGYCSPVDFIKRFGIGNNTMGKFASYRRGEPTRTHSCNNVRDVPRHLTFITRYNYYRKYTEAYGIPVVSSGRVSDKALKRACTILRFLYADRADTRRSMYKNYGRVGVIGIREVTNGIPEHSHLPAWWNTRARGLGAMVGIPISTAGEENLLCQTTGRYYGDDIFFHEASHSVAELAIRSGYIRSGPMRDFYTRLQAAYSSARRSGLWRGTYSMSTVREYFAEGSQSFHNCHTKKQQPGVHGQIYNRKRLYNYDRRLYNLLKEVYPCMNPYPCNCAPLTGLQLDCDGTGKGKKTKEEKEKGGTCTDTHKNCEYWRSKGTCAMEKWKEFFKVNCPKACNLCAKVTKAPPKPKPVTDAPKPKPVICKDIHASCKGWAKAGTCADKSYEEFFKKQCAKSCKFCVPVTEAPKPKPVPVTEAPKPKPVICKDIHASCKGWAKDGTCTNKDYETYFKKQCAKSCKFCVPATDAPPRPKPVTDAPPPKPEPVTDAPPPKPDPVTDAPPPEPDCTDKHKHCNYWSKGGYCTDPTEASYMKKTCCKSCKSAG